jgi:hypothetical protein
MMEPGECWKTVRLEKTVSWKERTGNYIPGTRTIFPGIIVIVKWIQVQKPERQVPGTILYTVKIIIIIQSIGTIAL